MKMKTRVYLMQLIKYHNYLAGGDIRMVSDQSLNKLLLRWKIFNKDGMTTLNSLWSRSSAG